MHLDEPFYQRQKSVYLLLEALFMDVRQASIAVRKYFEDVKGMQPLSFDIENAQLENNGEWAIRCSFYRNPLESKRTIYHVFVKDSDGSIVRVAQLLETKQG